MIEIKQVACGYGRKTVLTDIACTMEDGQLGVLIGRNGCGKSTLLKTIAGIQAPLSGQILLAGHSLFDLSVKDRARRISYLPQSRNVPAITVMRMVLHSRFPYLSYPRRYRAEDFNIARDALARVGMAEFADADMQRLSGGQRQKVYLAMLLAQDTDVVLLDEPTTYLDIACQLDTWALCRSLCDTGRTVVTVTHDLQMALQYADKLFLLDGGRMRMQGSSESLMKQGVLEDAFGVSLRRFEDNYFIQKKEEDTDL